MKLTVIGAGYVGLATSLGFASMGHEVMCVENDASKLALLSSGQLPIFEPDMEEVLQKKLQDKGLQFTDKLSSGVNWSENIFVTIGSLERSEGTVETSFFLDLAAQIASFANRNFNVIIKSTIPVGTLKSIEICLFEKLSQKKSDLNFKVFSNPEFLKQGSAFQNFMQPERIVVGTSASEAEAKSLFYEIYFSQRQKNVPILVVPFQEAEFSKLAANAYLATKISLMNSFALYCDEIGADINLVEQILALDSRIGSQFLKSGIGYGGSCLPRDVRSLIGMSQNAGLEPRLLKAVNEVNLLLPNYFVQKIRSQISNLADFPITVWGLSFKAGTDDVRESPALKVVNSLISEGCQLVIYDPLLAKEKKYPTTLSSKKVRYVYDLPESLTGTKALCILTDSLEFSSQVSALQNWKGKYVFDGRNTMPPSSVQKLGFHYIGIGYQGAPR